jgi:hypothetical protein
MAFTRPLVAPVDIPERPVPRAVVSLVLGARPWAARWGPVFVVASLLVFLVWGVVQRSVAADRVRRAEVEAREGHLYRQLSNRDAILESQRRIYLERIRRLEAELREKDQPMSVSRTRAAQPMQGPAGSTEGCRDMAVIFPRG